MRSGVDRLLDELPATESAVLGTWLHDRSMSDETIELELFKGGHQLSDSTIRRWRKRHGIETVWSRS